MSMENINANLSTSVFFIYYYGLLSVVIVIFAFGCLYCVPFALYWFIVIFSIL